MKKITLALLGFALSFGANAQDLPAPSPSATVKQRVGLTDFTLTYSRPSMRGREIFGGLVPYKELWRTGANANTMIELSTAATIMKDELPAGKYSIFTIPGEKEWTIIFNKNIELWGTDGYSEKEDVLRITVPTGKTEKTETLSLSFGNISANGAELILAWETTEVRIPIEVNSREEALKNIKIALKEESKENLWRVYRNAANYYYQNNMDLAEAESMISSSIKLKNDSWYSYWLQAEILAERGEAKKAIESAQKAIKLGKEEATKAGREFGYAKMIEDAMAKWKA